MNIDVSKIIQDKLVQLEADGVIQKKIEDTLEKVISDAITSEINCYSFRSCRIDLTELKPKGMGVWAAKRTRVQMEGDEPDVEEIYHRFFIRFLTTGG